MICDSYIRPMQKMHTYDSVSPLSSRVRFVKQNLMSSESLLRIVVNKSHLARRASHYVLYPKFLVNYPFVPLTAFLDLSESVVWNESGTNHESRTNQEHWNESGTPPPVENDPPPVEIKSHPLQWKYRPHRWKCGTHLGN